MDRSQKVAFTGVKKELAAATTWLKAQGIVEAEDGYAVKAAGTDPVPTKKEG